MFTSKEYITTAPAPGCTVAEAVQKKQDCEIRIKDLLNEFIEDTGMQVINVILNIDSGQVCNVKIGVTL